MLFEPRKRCHRYIADGATGCRPIHNKIRRYVVEPSIAIEMILVKWKILKINLEDLAKLRWIVGLTIPQICNAVAKSRSTIQVSIRTIRNNGMSQMNFSDSEKITLQDAISKEIRKYGILGRKD